MKKAVCVLLTLLLITGTFAGCGKKNTAETTAATIAQTTAEKTIPPAHETTTAAPVLTDEQILALPAGGFFAYLNSFLSGLDELGTNKKATELTAKQFLNYIKNKKVHDVVAFIAWDILHSDSSELDTDARTNKLAPNAYSFFNNIDVDSYDIAPAKSGSGLPTDFKVTLHISKSSSELFPVGTSNWILRIGTSAAAIGLFREANKSADILGYVLDNTTNFCFGVSNFLGCYETMENFNKLVPDTQNKENFSLFCYNLINTLYHNSPAYSSKADPYPIKRTEIEKMARDAIGITNIDFKKCFSYNSTDDTVTDAGFDGWMVSADLSSSTFNSSTGIRTVVIDYYSDDAHLLKAKTMKYSLRENKDKSLTLLSTRLIYDSGNDCFNFF